MLRQPGKQPAPIGRTALLAGAATVFGFAPFGVAFLPVVTFAFLLSLWQGATTPRPAAVTGYAFGLGLFGAGASWVFVALNTFGGMPWPLAGDRHCRLLRVSRAVSGRPPVAGDALDRAAIWQRAIAAAALWAVSEWLRGASSSRAFPGCRLGTHRWVGMAPRWRAMLLWAACFSSRSPSPCSRPRSRSRSTRSPTPRAGGSRSRGPWCAVVSVAGAALARIDGRPNGGAGCGIAGPGQRDAGVKFDPDFRRQTFELYTGLVARAAAGSSCCRRARSRCSRTKCRRASW